MDTDNNKSQTAPPAGPILPSYFAALRFTCGCFGVDMPEMQATLRIMRKREKAPDEHFPKRLSRVMLGDAELGKGRWRKALATIGHEALYDRIRRENGKPLFGATGDMTERLVFAMLRLYERILPELNIDRVAIQDALWLLIEEVFVPTAYIELALNRRRGLGAELELDACWYLPVMKKGELLKPIPRVLEYWLRAAGFRNGYDVGKALDSDSVRKQVDRWGKGKHVPTIGDLHGLVQKFGENVSWMGTRDEWKCRFTLACAMQNICEAIDTSFRAVRPNASLELGKNLLKMRQEGMAVDDDQVLADRHVFFAARLWQRRLQNEDKWDKAVMAHVRASAERKCPADPTEEEMERLRAEFAWRRNPGNWFLQLIIRHMKRKGDSGKTGAAKFGIDVLANVQECIWAAGMAELNRLLDSKRGRRGSPRRP